MLRDRILHVDACKNLTNNLKKYKHMMHVIRNFEVEWFSFEQDASKRKDLFRLMDCLRTPPVGDFKKFIASSLSEIFDNG